MRPSARGSRPRLAERLRVRRAEIERALLTRVYGVADPVAVADPTYREGLHAAVTAALDYGLAGIELGEGRAPAPPPAVLVQARQAARSGVSIDTVLRRYFAGYALLGDYLIEEAEAVMPDGVSPKVMLRDQAVLFDRLLAAVSEEYTRESAEFRTSSPERRRAERVRGLLDGEPLETDGLAYDFDLAHVGMIAVGAGAAAAIRRLAGTLGCRLLLVGAGDDSVWAWLGARHSLDFERLRASLADDWPESATLAAGEAAKGLAGWRLTHRQARAALGVALRSHEKVVRYADVALAASMLQDDLLLDSLRQLYLDPLGDGRDGGEVVRETLRAFFAAERNVSSAAAGLGVSRQAVAKRLRAIEAALGRPLGQCANELEAALQIEHLTGR